MLEKGTTNKLLEYLSLIFKTCGGQYLFKSYQYYIYYSTTQRCDGPPVNQHEAGTIKVIKLQLPRCPCVFMHCKLGTGGLLFLNGTSFQTRMLQMLRCEGHSKCAAQVNTSSPTIQPVSSGQVDSGNSSSSCWKRLLCLKTQSTRQHRQQQSNGIPTSTRLQNLQSWCEANTPNLNRQQSTAAIIRLARQEKSTSFRSTLHVYRFLQLPLCKAVKKRTSDGLPAVLFRLVPPIISYLYLFKYLHIFVFDLLTSFNNPFT